ncbi:MAG: hypothetical protein ACXWC9_00435 [Pseudobdellovibrionaceae bacterium]
MSTMMNPLPPQAYTKDTLVHAYAWLQNQSEHIKELATTPDVLVSLYLKAKLQGDGALERPSIQNFKNELRNLAGMMGEFEVLESPAGSSASAPGNQTIRFRSQDLRPPEPKAEEKVASYSAAATHSHSQQAQAQHAHTQHAHGQAQVSAQAAQQSASASSVSYSAMTISHSTAANPLAGLDSRSLDMIQEVKIQFNLSSDTEALRLLLANGYNQIKGLLK